MPDGEGLQIWVIYDHPSDFPDVFVARRWINDKATKEVILSTDLQALQDEMERRGLVKLLRFSEDDPVIIETWM